MYCCYLLGYKTVLFLLFSIIIPFDNLKDIDKIEEQLRNKVQFYPVKEIKQVLAVAFPGLV